MATTDAKLPSGQQEGASGPDILAEIISDLDEDVKKEFCEAFKLFDGDDSGTISSQDMTITVRQLGFYPSEAQIRTWTAKYGNRNKKIGLQGFFHILKECLDGDNFVEELSFALDKLDPDKKGYLHLSEIKGLITGKGEAIPEREFDETMEALNIGTDGRISIQEILDHACSKSEK